MTDWTLFVADQGGTRVAQVDEYYSATIVARHNAVSTWELELPTDTPAAAAFLDLQNPRLVARFGNRTVRSGPLTNLARAWTSEGDDLTLNGVDDTVWLTRRVAHPMPAAAAPPYSQAYDNRTGIASAILAQYIDANAGPSAVAARRVPGLTCPPPAPAGGTVSLSARYQSLADMIFGAAEAVGLGVRIVDLALDVFTPRNTGAVFSADLGTLSETDSTEESPGSNFVYVAGQGVGGARTIVEVTDSQSVYDWGRVETFQDRRDTNDGPTLLLAGQETLASGLVPPSVTFQPIDTDAQTFGEEWSVGDLATVRVGNVVRTDIVREVTIRLEGGKPVENVARIGASGDLALFRATLDQSRRIRQLERSQ